MPKVKALTAIDRYKEAEEELSAKCEYLLIRHRISKTRVAEFIGISPQAVSQQFARQQITLEVFRAVMYLTDASAETIERMVKG